ncbi:PfkB family carbohydrate kinase [Bacillus sp. FJAT-27245]|uniref:PfkB family carbohydrate kinase n=1 Tax=Bacillus sp. FJAT-27245 TaxID=1684144 RepID=UPI0006A760FE|nr:PfkB family carbohydrate kinase [Bacillus sp. FJAT-27245]
MEKTLVPNSNVLVIGAAVVDVVIHTDTLPKTGEDVMGKLEKTIVGGCAYNVRQVIHRFDVPNTLFAPIGKGPYAQLIREEFMKQGIPLVLDDDSKDNGWNISFVEKDGERTFLTIPGLETCWKTEWFEEIDLSDYLYIYLSGYELEGPSGEVLVQEVMAKKAAHTKIIFDPGPRAAFLTPAVLEALLQPGTIVHCNQSELSMLYPAGDRRNPGFVEKAVAALHAQTLEAVVVTLGKDGCYYRDQHGSGYVSAKKVTVVDTIGAGDSHTGAFISGLAYGMSTEEACRLGNDVSAEVVQQSGGAWLAGSSILSK